MGKKKDYMLDYLDGKISMADNLIKITAITIGIVVLGGIGILIIG